MHSLKEWKFGLEKAKKYGICGLALQPDDQDSLGPAIKLVCLALPDKSVYISDGREQGTDGAKEMALLLAALLEQRSIRKVIYGAGPALSLIRGSAGRKINACNVFDLMLASQICWSGYYYLRPSGSTCHPWKRDVPDHSLGSLAERHLGIILDGEGGEGDRGGEGDSAEEDNAEEDRAEEGDGNGDGLALKRALVLLPLHNILAELLARNGLEKIADLEFQVAASLAEMQGSGIHLECDQARGMVCREEYEICNLVSAMQEEARRKGFVKVSHDGKRLCCYLNPDRTEDVMAFLRRRGYPVSSTKAEILKGLAAAGCAFAEALLRYRRVCHQLTFLCSWLEKVSPEDCRVHPHFFQIQSSTGRISSRNPNAHQIPSTGEDASAIRRLFTPAEGKKFVKADFSTIELRIMAWLSGDRVMLEALKNGVDLHRLTASPAAAIAFYDPRLGAVVVATHRRKWAVWQVVDVTVTAER